MANTLRQIITGSGTISAGAASVTISLTAAGGLALEDLSKAFCFVHFNATALTNGHQSAAYNVEILDTTNLRLQLDTTASGNTSSEYSWTVIEFEAYSDIDVQHQLLNVAVGDHTGGSPATSSQTIGEVTLAQSMILSQGHNHFGGSDETVGGEEAYRVKLDTSTSWSINTEVWMNDASAQEDHRAQIIDWGDAGVSAQTGEFTFSSGLQYDTIIPPTSVDPTRTLLLTTYSHTGITVSLEDNAFSAYLNTAGEIELFRYFSSTETQTVHWQLIEFPSSFLSVQHLQLSPTTDDQSFDINTVDLERSFILGTISTYWGWGWGATSFSDLSTSIREISYESSFNSPYSILINNGSAEEMTISLQVVEFVSTASSSSSSQSSSSSSSRDILTTMTEYYVATSGGSDNNDGGDVLGFTLDASWTTATKRLTQTGAFSSYTFTSGDIVFLSHASITDGTYTISQKIDNNIIELVDSISGSDQTNVKSSTGPFATMTQAATQTSAGDMVFLCTIADGEKFNSEPSYPVSLSATGNITNGLIQWSGANSSGIVDGTMAVVSNPSTGDVIQCETNANDQYFQYISAEDGSRGWDLQGPDFIIWWRCEARNNSSGWTFSAGNMNCIECLSEENATRGFWGAGSETAFIDCVAKNNNTEAGFDGASSLINDNAERSVAFRCLSYNDTTGSQDNGFRRQAIIANCVAYNNTQDGVELSATHIGRGHIIIDSLFIENEAWGISDAGAGGLFLNNAFYNNTSGEMETDPVTEGIESNSITLPANPFQDVTNNNFTLNRDRAGLLSRKEIYQGDWIKKPANLVLNSDFNNDDNWTVQGSWTIANGVAHHSTGDASVLDYDANIITDGVEYETIFTVLNYVSGSVNITLGSIDGTSRSADGIFREIITGGNPTPESSEQTLAITPTSDFVGDIDDVLVAPIHSGPQGSRGSGGGRMKSHGARGAARPKDRRIKVG